MPLPYRHARSAISRMVYSVLVVVSFSCLASDCVGAAEFVGRVVGVIDGDTLDVLTGDKTQIRVRVAGIDAPEKSQAFGQKSKQALSDLVYGKTVSVLWKKHDRYKRVIGKIEVDKVDAGLAMIQSGLAWHYKKYQSEQSRHDRALYHSAEVAARSERLGLWTDNDPIAPWDFRAAPKRINENRLHLAPEAETGRAP